ncbi:MAG: hypothetical protein IRZ11_04790 [Clostridia bacterium]|nr:hypothetical protein [Clostridia bacterium]
MPASKRRVPPESTGGADRPPGTPEAERRRAAPPGDEPRPPRPRRPVADPSLQGLVVMFVGAAIVWQADAIGQALGIQPALAATTGLFISASGLVIQRRSRR